MKTPLVALTLVSFFISSIIGPLPYVCADEFHLPALGVMVRLSPPMLTPILKGIKVDTQNPFHFDFILDRGDSLAERMSPPNASVGGPQQEQLKTEATKLIKYFLASLTIPEDDLWVNLSPYEKNRIIPHSFGLTEMGRDLLAEDYMLKQLSASLIYPEDEIGKKFWKRIYEEAQKKFGTTNIPVNTFNKVWIVPDKAVVYENSQGGTAYVVESTLKVMLEQDYLAMQKNNSNHSLPLVGRVREGGQDVSALGSQIIREIVIPELTKEVNEGKNFSQLRQVYNSLILADWYKKKIKDSILEQVYVNKNKISGIAPLGSLRGRSTKQSFNSDVEYIYQRYLQAFKKGVYNYIKEEPVFPPTSGEGQGGEKIPRKYFSGGVGFYRLGNKLNIVDSKSGKAMLASVKKKIALAAGLVLVSATLLVPHFLKAPLGQIKIEHLKAHNDYLVGVQHTGPKSQQDDQFIQLLTELALDDKIVLGLENIPYTTPLKGSIYGIEDDFANAYVGILLKHMEFSYFTDPAFNEADRPRFELKIQEDKTKIIYDLMESINLRNNWNRLEVVTGLSESVRGLYNDLNEFMMRNEDLKRAVFLEKFNSSPLKIGREKAWHELIGELARNMTQDLDNHPQGNRLDKARILAFIVHPDNPQEAQYVTQDVTITWRNGLIDLNIKKIEDEAASRGLNAFFPIGRGHVKGLSKTWQSPEGYGVGVYSDISLFPFQIFKQIGNGNNAMLNTSNRKSTIKSLVTAVILSLGLGLIPGDRSGDNEELTFEDTDHIAFERTQVPELLGALNVTNEPLPSDMQKPMIKLDIGQDDTQAELDDWEKKIHSLRELKVQLEAREPWRKAFARMMLEQNANVKLFNLMQQKPEYTPQVISIFGDLLAVRKVQISPREAGVMMDQIMTSLFDKRDDQFLASEDPQNLFAKGGIKLMAQLFDMGPNDDTLTIAAAHALQKIIVANPKEADHIFAKLMAKREKRNILPEQRASHDIVLAVSDDFTGPEHHGYEVLSVLLSTVFEKKINLNEEATRNEIESKVKSGLSLNESVGLILQEKFNLNLSAKGLKLELGDMGQDFMRDLLGKYQHQTIVLNASWEMEQYWHNPHRINGYVDPNIVADRTNGNEVLYVFAAGNGVNGVAIPKTYTYPIFDDVLMVGATKPEGLTTQREPFSNFGPDNNFYTPDISPSGWKGTSFSAPLAGGMVIHEALAHPDEPLKQIIHVMNVNSLGQVENGGVLVYPSAKNRAMLTTLLQVQPDHSMMNSLVLGNAYGGGQRVAYEKGGKYWKTHIDNSRKYILEGMKRIPAEHRRVVTILGGGQAREIPLLELAENFEQVNLVDIDIDSMRKAVELLPELMRHKVKMLPEDVSSGKVDVAIAEVGKIIGDHRYQSDPKGAAVAILNAMAGIQFTGQNQELIKHRSDYVVSSVMSDQIVGVPFLFIEAVFKERYKLDFREFVAKENLTKYYSQVKYDLIRRSMEQHALLLRLLASPDGLIYWSSTYRSVGYLRDFTREQRSQLSSKFIQRLKKYDWNQILDQPMIERIESYAPQLHGKMRVMANTFNHSTDGQIDVLFTDNIIRALLEDVLPANIAEQILTDFIAAGTAVDKRKFVVDTIGKEQLSDYFLPYLEPIDQGQEWLWINDFESSLKGDGRSFYVQARLLKPIKAIELPGTMETGFQLVKKEPLGVIFPRDTHGGRNTRIYYLIASQIFSKRTGLQLNQGKHIAVVQGAGAVPVDALEMQDVFKGLNNPDIRIVNTELPNASPRAEIRSPYFLTKNFKRAILESLKRTKRFLNSQDIRDVFLSVNGEGVPTDLIVVVPYKDDLNIMTYATVDVNPEFIYINHGGQRSEAGLFKGCMDRLTASGLDVKNLKELIEKGVDVRSSKYEIRIDPIRKALQSKGIEYMETDNLSKSGLTGVSVITANNLLMHYTQEQQEALLKEWMLSLREGGVIVEGETISRGSRGLLIKIFQRRGMELTQISQLTSNDETHQLQATGVFSDLTYNRHDLIKRFWGYAHSLGLDSKRIKGLFGEEYLIALGTSMFRIDLTEAEILSQAEASLKEKQASLSRAMTATAQNPAMPVVQETKTGGINLTRANMNIQTKSRGSEIKFHMDPAMLQQFQNAPGFEPEITNMQPLKNIQEFLGLK